MNGKIAPTAKKKLIEVALPLEAINRACAREKSISHGHPSTLHLWWARRPLAAARAVIFAQMVDDPSSHPETFLTEDDQTKERQRLLQLIEELVKWENSNNHDLLEQARTEIWRSWHASCADNHSFSPELFNPDRLPSFHDPFAGGGTFPVEAQRLGLESYASDLNPVSVLINKAMIEVPPKFAGIAPVNPQSRATRELVTTAWQGVSGLVQDVRYYGRWMRDEAEKRIGELYPKVEISESIAADRPDLRPLIGEKLTVIAWLWARTVKSPDPAFAKLDVPLISTFMLSTKSGKEAYLEPVIERDTYRLTVKIGKPSDTALAKRGTKLGSGANFRCLMSGAPIAGPYIMAEGQAGRLGSRLMAIVAEGKRGRVYLSPTSEHEATALGAKPRWQPDVQFFQQALGFRIGNYGMSNWSDLFSSRQLVAMTTLSDLVLTVRDQVVQDAAAVGISTDNLTLDEGGVGALAYADAVALYLALNVSRQANRSAMLSFWDSEGQKVQQVFARQALSMLWDYAEANPFSDSSGNFLGQLDYLTNALLGLPLGIIGHALQADAGVQDISRGKIVSCDPPYFDNIGYADLSEFFYVWLRSSLRGVFPSLFSTVGTPKTEELVATPARHGGKKKAEAFFLEGMARALKRLADEAHPGFPVTIYYAFKQAETDSDEGTSSTGWEAFLGAVIQAGFAISATWPVRTEYTSNLKTKRSALASSIVLGCRPRGTNAPVITRREFLNHLKAELPPAVAKLQSGNIAPVDLAQAAIGPGMGVYSRYSQVVDTEGKVLSVGDALRLINQTLDEIQTEQEGDFDAASRWALAWFEQYGFGDGEYGRAETLSKAKNTSIGVLIEAGIVASKGPNARLLAPAELALRWDPAAQAHISVWQIVHHLIGALESGGEIAASEILMKLGSQAEIGRELAYRLYTLCDRKKRAADALSYNSLVQSWPEISRLARERRDTVPSQAQLF